MTTATYQKKAKNTASKKLAFDPKTFQAKILKWYDAHQRVLPWRAEPGQKPNLYHVWLSEIMLQQTTVGAVIPYFQKFIKTWPDFKALAMAKDDDVMRAWAGLGYYSRARNLLKCAREVLDKHNGALPSDISGLMALPGIGPYTAAAIRSIGHGLPAAVIDGNIERITARVFQIEKPLPDSKKEIHQSAKQLFNGLKKRPGDLAQALMDLGAGVCIPKTPRCTMCPVKTQCMAYAGGAPGLLPLKKRSALKPQRFGHVYWVKNKKGEILLVKRSDKGLLGGMWALPSSHWEAKTENIQAPPFLSLKSAKSYKAAFITHVFTHFDLKLMLYTAKTLPKDIKSLDHVWVSEHKIIEHGLPTVFVKAARTFLEP
jgi:A/G-specific adenine glycosylase